MWRVESNVYLSFLSLTLAVACPVQRLTIQEMMVKPKLSRTFRASKTDVVDASGDRPPRYLDVRLGTGLDQ